MVFLKSTRKDLNKLSVLGYLVFSVSTVKFDLQEDLEELQARIYLDTKKKLSKKDILELTFRIGSKNYEELIREIQLEKTVLDDNIIESVLASAADFGEGTEKLSSQINKITYDLES